MGTRARRLAIPLAGAFAASGLAGAPLTGAAHAVAADEVQVRAAGDAEKARAFWTAARMRAAQSRTETLSAGAAADGARPAPARAVAPDGPPGSVPPGGPSSPGKGKDVSPPRTTGKVFFRFAGDPRLYWCSASSVNAPDRSLVATAGHCVYDTDTRRWAEDWIFVPGYRQDKAPYGVYAAARFNADDDYVKRSDYDYDYAFVNVTRDLTATRHRRLGDVVGAQGLTWNRSAKVTVFAFGYPAGPHPDGDRPYSGHTVKWCYGTTAAMPKVKKFKVERHIGLRCAFTAGGSGGPLLAGYRNATGRGYLNGVVSLAWDTDGNGRYDRASTSYFNGETHAVYKTATRKRPK
ncbi:trypsin-like serine peptidase [Bailinhaonella thermotolerans]|uniref:Serine protease n=1 Tax=Bailinhaonella thermotolerans TaxID=1070861 RepID=A0A3A4ALQ2_9ACTN|nr:trypsin-like peptidase domain-containing protein [Bailinhaonella thermotolerans]RJL26590.1 serine protease [Bailinhaonella thermotolerans]